MDFVKIKSRAKINLTLDVLHKRPDGYHELETIMQTLFLYDSMYVTIAPTKDIVLKSNISFLPKDERNLAVKAAAFMQERFDIKKGVYIELTKRIPISAGLGGGSGNCAAILRSMNLLFQLGLSDKELRDIGICLGSDVPYCLMGGTVLAKGKGEILTKLKPCPHFYVVLAKPRTGISTAFVYNNLNLENIEKHPDTKAVINAIENEDKLGIAQNLSNVLEPVTMSYKPVVKEIKEFLKENGAMAALMSGSGPTVFGLFEKKEEAERAMFLLMCKFRIKEVFLTKTEQRLF